MSDWMKYGQRLLGILFLTVFVFHFSSSRAQNIPVPLTEKYLYDFLDELATDGIIQLNTAVRPYSRQQVAQMMLRAQEKDSLLSRRQRKDVQFYLNEFSLELDTVPTQFVQYTDHETFNLSLCDPQFSYISRKTKVERRTKANANSQSIIAERKSMFKMQIRPILGMDLIGSQKGLIIKRWWGAELKMDIARHVSIWGSLRDISWNGQVGLRNKYYPDTYAKIDGAKLTKGQFLNNLPGVQYKEANYGGDFSDSKGGISVYAWWGSVSLSRETIQWGDAFHSSNILSGHNPAVPQFSIQLTPVWWFQFDYFHAWLVSNVVDSTDYYIENGKDKEYRQRPKYMAANMFTFMPIKYISFSLGNSIVYAERNPQAAYFIPIAFYKSLDHLLTKGLGQENQNSQAFFTLTLRPVDHLKLYGSFYIDEIKWERFKSSNPQHNPISYLVGFDWTGWPIKGLSLKGEFMRSYIACYTHSIPALAYASNSYRMGHYLGDNAQNIHAELSYRPIRGMKLAFSYNNDTKYNAYDYVRGNIKQIISQKPFDQVIYRNEEFALDLFYEVHPHMYLRANVTYNNARAYDHPTASTEGEMTGTAQEILNLYQPLYYQGKNLIATVGFSFGF